MKKLILLGIVCAFLALPMAALADSLTPTAFNATLNVGESETVHKKLHVVEKKDVPLDVLFLFDTTGSMGGAIAGATAAANTIMTDIDAAVGDVRFGVAEYKDFYKAGEWWGDPTDYPYKTVTALTANTAAVQAGIGSLSASGGNDWPESNFYALQQAAETLSWDPGAVHVAVWFGDAVAHDPDDTPGYPGPTIGTTISALQGAGISVIALDYWGGLDVDGEATAITAATGGGVYPGATDPDDIADLIIGKVSGLFDDYSEVKLGVVGDASGLEVTIVPASYVGTWDRSKPEEFEFDVTFKGVTPGDYSFGVAGYVDGVVVAIEKDRIKVTGVPEPATMLLIGSGLLGLAGIRRRLVK